MGRYLRATASYSDAVDGADQTASRISSNAVQAATTPADPVYDANRDGIIDSTEVLQAVADYFNNVIGPTRVLAIVALYFQNF